MWKIYADNLCIAARREHQYLGRAHASMGMA
jgi:hypothetical protein